MDFYLIVADICDEPMFLVIIKHAAAYDDVIVTYGLN